MRRLFLAALLALPALAVPVADPAEATHATGGDAAIYNQVLTPFATEPGCAQQQIDKAPVTPGKTYYVVGGQTGAGAASGWRLVLTDAVGAVAARTYTIRQDGAIGLNGTPAGPTVVKHTTISSMASWSVVRLTMPAGYDRLQLERNADHTFYRDWPLNGLGYNGQLLGLASQLQNRCGYVLAYVLQSAADIPASDHEFAREMFDQIYSTSGRRYQCSTPMNQVLYPLEAGKTYYVLAGNDAPWGLYIYPQGQSSVNVFNTGNWQDGRRNVLTHSYWPPTGSSNLAAEASIAASVGGGLLLVRFRAPASGQMAVGCNMDCCTPYSSWYGEWRFASTLKTTGDPPSVIPGLKYVLDYAYIGSGNYQRQCLSLSDCQAFGWIFEEPPGGRIAEKTIRETQSPHFPYLEKVSGWTRANPALERGRGCAASNPVATAGQTVAEAIYNPTVGRPFLETLTYYADFTANGATGTASIIVDDELSYSGGTQLARVDFTYNRPTAGTTVSVDVNWRARTLTSTGTSFSGVTWAVNGTSVSAGDAMPTLPKGAPFYLVFTSGSNYGASRSSATCTSGPTTGTLYEGPPSPSCGGVPCETVNRGLYGLRAYTSGGATSLTTTADFRAVRGTLMLYTREDGPNPGRFAPTTHLGPVVRVGNPEAGTIADVAYSAQAWRLFHGRPGETSNNASQTWTLTIAPPGKNVVMIGTPNTGTHVRPIMFYSTIIVSALQFWSTDDPYASVQFTVYECAVAFCETVGGPLAGVNYTLAIPGRSLQVGRTDVWGSFYAGGSDLAGRLLKATATAEGYQDAEHEYLVPAQGGDFVTTFSMQTTEAYHAGLQENAQLDSLGIMATWLPFILLLICAGVVMRTFAR